MEYPKTTPGSMVTPTFAPSSQPSVPEPSTKCSLEQAEEDETCFFSSDANLYGCLELQSLVSVRPNIFCESQNPVLGRVGFRSCQEVGSDEREGSGSNDQQRDLRSKKAKKMLNDHMFDHSGDEVEAPLVSDPLLDIPSLEIASAVGSNDRGLDSFLSEDCRLSHCTRVENYVCFPTDLDVGEDLRKFVVTLSTKVNGAQGFYDVSIVVQRGDDTRTQLHCRDPETTCIGI